MQFVANLFAKILAPTNLTMPDFSALPGGWVGGENLDADFEEWRNCDVSPPIENPSVYLH